MIEVSAGIIITDSKILCFQKGKAKYPYLSFKYEFPGGKIEPGETPKQTIIRELKEELSIDISKNKIEFLCETTTDYPDFSVKLHSFLIWADNVNYTLSEHQQAIWSEIDNLEKLDWAKADVEIVEIVKKHLSDHNHYTGKN